MNSTNFCSHTGKGKLKQHNTSLKKSVLVNLSQGGESICIRDILIKLRKVYVLFLVFSSPVRRVEQ